MSTEPKFIAVAARGVVTYYAVEKIAEETVDSGGDVTKTDGALPDGAVVQYSAAIATVKNYKNGLLDGDVKTYDLKTGRNTLTETYQDGELKRIVDTATFSPINPAGEAEDASKKGVTRVRSGETVIFYKDNKETARETLGPRDERVALEGIIPDGEVREYYDGKTVKTIAVYKDNAQNGLCKRYDEAGRKISEENYKDGRLDGGAAYYDYLGDVPYKEEASYKNGLLEGRRICHYPGGAVHLSETYERNRRHGKREVFFENGILNLEEEHKNGRLDGARIFYHQGGAVWYKENYINGLLEGERNCYFESGELQMKENYEGGLLEGNRKVFDKSGTILLEENYQWGAPTRRKK